MPAEVEQAYVAIPLRTRPESSVRSARRRCFRCETPCWVDVALILKNEYEPIRGSRGFRRVRPPLPTICVDCAGGVDAILAKVAKAEE